MTVGGTHLRVLTRGAGGGAVQVARPLTEVDDQLRGHPARSWRWSARAAWRWPPCSARCVARTALAPIGALHEPHRGGGGGPGPVAAHGGGGATTSSPASRRSFNATLDALERSVEAQRQLVADASHELRTPIASLRANIQTLEEADRLPAGRAGRAAGGHRRTSSTS